MEIKINIPDNFTNDYIGDKFKDFFSRVITDIDNKGMCGNFEKEIAEMLLKAFDESIEANNTCNCQHNNNQRDNEPCCRCDSRQTNGDRIRNMSDEELAELLESKENVEKCYCKTTDYLTIRRDVIGYGRSLVVGIDFKKKAITTYYAYACDSGTSKNLNIEYCPLCGEKL